MTIDEATRKESERFLQEECGAKKSRLVDTGEFANLAAKNNLLDKVGIRTFQINQLKYTQFYTQLNGEHVYSVLNE